jgi:hypothetical protein
MMVMKNSHVMVCHIESNYPSLIMKFHHSCHRWLNINEIEREKKCNYEPFHEQILLCFAIDDNDNGEGDPQFLFLKNSYTHTHQEIHVIRWNSKHVRRVTFDIAK